MTSEQTEFQREYYDRHFPNRKDVTARQIDHPLFRSFYDRLAGVVFDKGGVERTVSGDNRPLRLLEIGCGEGLLGSAIHRVAAQRALDLDYCGTDLSAAGLDLARPYVSGELLQGDATQVVAGLPAGSRDIVVVKNLLHHLDDPAELMRSAARVVGQNGRVVVIEACLGAPQFWVFTFLAPRREKYFFRGRQRNLAAIRDGGLRIVDTTRFSWLPYELAFGTRFDVLRHLLGTSEPARIQQISRLDERLTSAMPWSSSYIVWTTEQRES